MSEEKQPDSTDTVNAHLEATDSLEIIANEAHQETLTNIAVKSIEELDTMTLSIANLTLENGQIQKIIDLLVQLANPIYPVNLDKNPQLKTKVEDTIITLDNFLSEIPETTTDVNEIQAAKDIQYQLNGLSLELLRKPTENTAIKNIIADIDTQQQELAA